MSEIHQIYCTHCTHGSSALERREGELAHRMLGYSARAGSLPAAELRGRYRQIERYLYYYLPRDTPVEAKLSLGASTAPRRLIYLPSVGGLQMVGQICYRPTDTEGRPGSYFAHVLFRDAQDDAGPWSILDCLKLWNAPGWIEEDSPQIPFLLKPLAALDELLQSRRPAVDDHVLRSFLTTPAGGSFDDPGRVIPARWRQKDPAGRRALLADALDGLLEIGIHGGQLLLLVLEPELAALVFYGIVRLLPEGPLRRQISFCTFEPNPDQACTTLAATAFHDPTTSDLRPDAYRLQAVVINTFLARRSERRKPQGQYARTLVAKLVQQDWQAVDWALENMRTVGAQEVEELERLAAVDRMLPGLLQPRQSPPDQGWRRWPMTADYLRRSLRRELAGLADPEASLPPLVGGPAHLLILELAAAERELPGTRRAVEYLLKILPDQQIADLLKLDQVSSADKIAVLVRYAMAHGELPPGCDWLWDESAAGHPARPRAGPPLLPQLLAELDSQPLAEFYSNTSARHSDAFVMNLLEACTRKRSKRLVLPTIIKAMNDQALLSAFGACGPALLRQYPEDAAALGNRLQQMLRSLPEQLDEFSPRLDLVLAGQRFLPSDADRQTAAAWDRCRQAILEIGRLQNRRRDKFSRRPSARLEAACQQMAEAAARAIPRDVFDRDPHPNAEQRYLRDLGKRLLQDRPLLPSGTPHCDVLWRDIVWCLSSGYWPPTLPGKLWRTWQALKSSWFTGGGVAALRDRINRCVNWDYRPRIRLGRMLRKLRALQSFRLIGSVVLAAVILVLLVVVTLKGRTPEPISRDSGSLPLKAGPDKQQPADSSSPRAPAEQARP